MPFRLSTLRTVCSEFQRASMFRRLTATASSATLNIATPPPPTFAFLASAPERTVKSISDLHDQMGDFVHELLVDKTQQVVRVVSRDMRPFPDLDEDLRGNLPMIYIENSNVANLNLGSQIGTINAAIQNISKGDESQKEFARALEEFTQAVVSATLSDANKREVVEALSTDGFGKSSASAHLHVRTQDGRIKTVGEFVAPHLPAYEFAQEVVRRLVAPLTQGQHRKIIAVYLDPSNFKNIGDGHTIADQINQVLVNQVLEPYDLAVIPASNDRIGG